VSYGSGNTVCYQCTTDVTEVTKQISTGKQFSFDVMPSISMTVITISANLHLVSSNRSL